MKIKKRWILLLMIIIFAYSVIGINFGYNPEEPFDRPYFTGLIETSIFNSELRYGYDDNVTPKNMIIKITNIFGGEKIVVEKTNPPINSNNGKEISFKQIPFYTKEIVITTEMSFKGENMVVDRKFYPYFKFGIWEFWYIPFPFMWEFINGKLLFKWGYL